MDHSDSEQAFRLSGSLVIWCWVKSGISLCHSFDKLLGPQRVTRWREPQQFSLAWCSFNHKAGHRFVAGAAFISEGTTSVPRPVFAGIANMHSWSMSLKCGECGSSMPSEYTVQTDWAARYDHWHRLLVGSAIGHHTDRCQILLHIIEAIEKIHVHIIIGLDDWSQCIITVVDMKFSIVFLASVFHSQMSFAKANFSGAENTLGRIDQIRMDSDVIETGVIPGEESLFRSVILSFLRFSKH